MKIWTTIGAVVVIGGGALYFASSSSDKAGGNATTTAETMSETASAGSSGNPASIEDAMARGGDYKCTFTIAVANSTSEGTIYVSGKNFSGSFKSVAAGQTVTARSVSDGKFAYTWMEGTGFGTKVPIIDNGSYNPAAGMTGSMNFSNNMGSTDYNCVAEIAPSGAFDLPSNIQFMEAPAAAQQ